MNETDSSKAHDPGHYRSATRFPAKAIAYCATCRAEYGEADEKYIGVRFLCPCDDPNVPGHYSAVVKDERGEFWLRAEAMLNMYEKHYSPMRWLAGGMFRRRGGIYVALRLALAFVVYGVAFGTPAGGILGTAVAATVVLVSSLIIGDLLIVATSIAFITRFPVHPLRSAVLGIVGFLSLVVAFGAVHALLRDKFNESLNPVNTLYFSMVTMTTLGYGDIHPKLDAWTAQIVVAIQLLTGLYYLGVILVTMVSWANAPPTAPVVHPLADLVNGQGVERVSESEGAS